MAIPEYTVTQSAWSKVGTAQRALMSAIRSKPQKLTIPLWQEFALACQVFANAAWAEEQALSKINPSPPQPPPPEPPAPDAFDPRITYWTDKSGEQHFDFPSCPFKVGK